MKFFLPVLSLFVGVFFFMFASFALAAPSIATVLPNGGECVEVGKPYIVTWSASEVAHAAFYFVKSGSSTSTPPTYGSWNAHPISGTSWSWTPLSSDVSESGRIWIEGHDANHARLVIDSSNGTFSVRSNCALDTVKPGKITTLSIKSVVGTAVTLEWTATGDDGKTGTAASHDIRYFTSPITEGNWSGRTQASGEPTPAISGTIQSFSVTGLSPETKYYFAIRAIDEASNISDLDTVAVTATTGIDVNPPIISNVSVTNITSAGATINFTTDEGATSELAYGKTTDYELPKITKTAFTTSHSIQLSDLTTQTTYHFKISAKDKNNNIGTTGDSTFTTLPSIITLTFVADKTTVVSGKDVLLTWDTQPSTGITCSASGGWSGTKPSSGSQIVTVNTSADYQLTCNTQGALTVTKTIKVSAIDVNFLKDGDLIRVSSLAGEEGRNIWIVKISSDRKKFYRRLILNPEIFSHYGHLKFSLVKEVSKEIRDAFDVSAYVRAYDPNPASFVDDPKVYLLSPNEQGDDGVKRHMNMSAQQFYTKVDTFAVFIINEFERDTYVTGTPITSL